MPEYTLRGAAIADAEAIVRHRIAMFAEMGVQMEEAPVAHAFRQWLDRALASGLYRGWLVETPVGDVVAGGGITVVPWPPGPRFAGDRVAFVYNLYTEPDHRRRGLARLIMDAIHTWCRAEGISSVALHASNFGRPLDDALGYAVTPNPMMVLALDRR